ncbi:MarR family transcriptional regulator [Pseudomonas oryzihabitans]|uniref:MarR family winged helix-turn-helix transcriptional regulator n=1 Tax=Pseudomonas rhizoryzae TaxID=2571129 RepID=UPI0007360CAE|nr:MarR family transcriptional regulator [Pseudomonas rhizoryzae]APQ14165.1 MarR family transcriptional regulator [Pseudomonas psychrotolerans]KTT03881.1 MarR family transcriptional regulator [Pseudomonas psychrotolerans]KTT13260.1 MarR family transcriptional regulator [Pseudomonas psychrotolerans]KTT24950.1 MarR family transcriptional regulator [Pseudomonas psychrotolerans]KTT31062.1 MarR family transcriptional regulator [Pseudomonas psychrotolerans]
MISPNDAVPLDTATTPWLDTAVGYALRRAQMKMFQHLVDSLAEYDLRPAQFTALVILEQEPGLMQADLARRLAIEPPQLVLLLNKLESQGLAARVRDTQDRRAYALHLTDQGRALVGELKVRAAASDRAASAPLDDTERAELLRLLRKLNGDLG